MGKVIDARRIAALSRGPGMDTRYNLVLAAVDAIVVDPEEGVFLDITLFPNEEPETAIMGVPYAGNGFGFYFPLYEEDVVLVAIPDGDTNSGPIVIARMWCKADPPPTEVKTTIPVSQAAGMYTPSDDVVLRVKSAGKFKTFTAGGGTTEITIEGAGKFILQTESGDVELLSSSGNIKMLGGTQPYVRGTTYADAEGVFLDALGVLMTGLLVLFAALGVFATAIGVAVPALAGAATTLNTAIGVFIGLANSFSTARLTFKNSRSTYLSTRIKGE